MEWLRLVSDNPHPIRTIETDSLELLYHHLPPEIRWRRIYNDRFYKAPRYPQRVWWAERTY